MTGRAGLVLTGGGARGAYQAGALLALSELSGARELPFPVITGSSAGSINASFLASRADDFASATRALADLWTTIEPSKVYRTGVGTLARTAVEWLADLGFGSWIGTGHGRALLETAPLHALIRENFDPRALHRHIAQGRVRGLGITATDYRNGLSVTFFEGAPDLAPWTRVTRIGVRAELSSDHVLASSAIPLFFPAVEIAGEWFADGSIRLGTPLSPAIRLGADRIVAIAVRQADVGGPPVPNPPSGYPSPAQTGGVLLNALFLEALESDIERTLRINHTLSLIPDDVFARKVTQLRPIEVLVLRPSRDPSSLVLRTIERFPATVRHLFRSLGASDDSGWDLLSYLGFDGVYTTRLFELGYEDTLRRRDEISAFLTRA
jgi:NTE family protein